MILLIVGCFILLISCVIGIADGPVNMVFLYEKEVQERAVELGLIPKEKIRRNGMLFKSLGFPVYMGFFLFAVYGINGCRGFAEGFRQLCILFLISGLFDRLFIDWYWVGKTKAWIIEGTEDLMPYIYGKTLIAKWLIVLIGFPILAALLSYVMNLILK